MTSTSTSIGQPPVPPVVDTDSTESDGKTLNDRGTNQTESTPDPSLEHNNGSATPTTGAGKFHNKSPYSAGRQ